MLLTKLCKQRRCMDRRDGVEQRDVRHAPCVKEEDERRECRSRIRRERWTRDGDMWRHNVMYLVRIGHMFAVQQQRERAQCSGNGRRHGREKNQTLVDAEVDETQYERFGSVAAAGRQRGVLLLLLLLLAVWLPGGARRGWLHGNEEDRRRSTGARKTFGRGIGVRGRSAMWTSSATNGSKKAEMRLDWIEPHN